MAKEAMFYEKATASNSGQKMNGLVAYTLVQWLHLAAVRTTVQRLRALWLSTN